jgi:four helix bundle protein
MEEFDFEKLKVYHKVLDFIDKIFAIYKNFSSDYKYSVGNNLLRAGMSIANNIAEGSDKKSNKERARYYRTSSDSTRECISVFNILRRQNLIEKDLYIQLRIDGREITNMLHGLIKSCK